MPRKLRLNRRVATLMDEQDDFDVETNKTFFDHFKETINSTKFRNMIRIGSELFEAVSPLVEKQTGWNYARALASCAKIVIDDIEIYPEEYFQSDDWIQPYSDDFNQTILNAISRFPCRTIRTGAEGVVIKIVDLNGAKVGYAFNTKLNSVDHFYVETSRLKKAQREIKNVLWSLYKDHNLVVKQTAAKTTNDVDRVSFEIDDAFQSLPSKKASEYSSYLKRCIDANVNRSVLFYGPPGTGKSTMARTIIDNLNMRSFRIRVEDIRNLENSTIFEAISIFQPDAVIIDDLDRSHSQDSLLETLEYFQRHIKLVIATVNDRRSLDEAILRPGRFDELIFVGSMDPEIVMHVLGADNSSAFNLVKDWPIAFINEFVKRRRFMNEAEAFKSTQELAHRVKRLERYNDVDQVELMTQLSSVTSDVLEGKKKKKKTTKAKQGTQILEENHPTSQE